MIKLQSPLSEKQDIGQSYDQYYASGLYEKRYPVANQNVLNFILHILEQEEIRLQDQDGKPVFLDFGCGNGRYLLPLLRNSQWSALAFDISCQAISQLEYSLNQQQVSLRCDILQEWPQSRKFNVALLLYGVLGHIKTRQERIQLLSSIRKQLLSTLIISVPNSQRRFLWERLFNKAQTDIEYQRQYKNQLMHFHYHLYSLQDLKLELEQSGLQIKSIHAESMLPEKWITNSTFWKTVDRVLSKILPLHWAYGFLVSAGHD